jgi:seryl-tRNA synthetase
LTRYSGGQVALDGNALRLWRAIDRVFLGWGEARGAVEAQFPPFIPVAELAKTDYLASFPHLATFAASLDPAEANLDAFSASPGAPGLAQLAPIRDVLTPAACYHFYIAHQGADSATPRYLTTIATCFRREDRFVPYERQSAFTMRELVCIGSADEVQAFLAAMRETIDEFVRALELPCVWETATDAFFKPAQNPKALMQRLAPSKWELCVDGLAIASINFHRNYFGEKFDLRRGGETAFSGCVAFGVERWLGVALRRWGADPSGWPAVWR